MKILVFAIVASLAYLLFAPKNETLGPPGHCWYYLHNHLKAVTFRQCIEKAKNAIASRGFSPEVRNSKDQHITYARARTDDISIDVLCYEVNGDRGNVMSFITVAGDSACNAAEAIFNFMKN